MYLCVWKGFTLTFNIKHPMQKAMQARINFLLSRIEEAGKDGIDENDLEQLFFFNGFGEPRLTRKYLSILLNYDKVKKEGTMYYSRNFPERGDPKQQKWEEILTDSPHTQTHTNSRGPISSVDSRELEQPRGSETSSTNHQHRGKN